MTPKQNAVDNAGRHLFNVEDRVDDAFEAAAMMAADLTRLRRDANLSSVAGQPIYAAAARLSGHLAEARREAVRIHGAMEELRIAAGLGELSFGPPDGQKPAQSAFQRGSSREEVARDPE